MAIVWELKLTPAERLVLLALADHSNDYGASVRPSLIRVAWKTGYSLRQTRRIVRALQRQRLLEVVAPAGQHRATEYRLALARGRKKPPLRPDIMSALSTGQTGHPQPPDRTSATARADTAMSAESSVSIIIEPRSADAESDWAKAGASKPPTVAELVNHYRALPGITRSDRDGSRFAWLVNTFPAAEVDTALVKYGPTLAIRARKDPIGLLHSIIKNERVAETSAQASFRRTAAVRDSLDSVVVGRSAETEAVLDEVRANLGIQNGNGAPDTDKDTTSATDAAKRAGMALIGDHLPPMPQRTPEEAVPA